MKILASYGGWNKFYGIKDIEFTVPNDTDDPTIYYDGKYYNYYDVEDALWDMFKEVCEAEGIDANEDDFEYFVKDNDGIVYEILDNLTPKATPGRGVRRDDGYLRRSANSSRRIRGHRVLAARVPKTVEQYVLQGNYGYGWDDLTYHDDMRDAKQTQREYIENEHIPTRIIKRRVPNPAYDPSVN